MLITALLIQRDVENTRRKRRTRSQGPITGGTRQFSRVTSSWLAWDLDSFSAASRASWEPATPTSVPGKLGWLVTLYLSWALRGARTLSVSYPWGRADRPPAWGTPGEAGVVELGFSHPGGLEPASRSQKSPAKSCSFPLLYSLQSVLETEKGMVVGTVPSLLALKWRNLRRHSFTLTWVTLHSGQLFREGRLPFQPSSRINHNCLAASLRVPQGPWQECDNHVSSVLACLSGSCSGHCSSLAQDCEARPTWRLAQNRGVHPHRDRWLAGALHSAAWLGGD